MKAVVVKAAKTNKTGSEPSRRFSKRRGGNGSIFVDPRAHAVKRREVRHFEDAATQRPFTTYLLDGMT